MPRTEITPGRSIESQLPTDWESVTEQEKTRLQAGLHECLIDMGAKCNGMKRGVDSVGTTISQRIRASAISKRVELGIKDLAAARGVDVSVASRAEIAAASTADEINSLIAFESIISQSTIEQVMTVDDMAIIEREELKKSRRVSDPEWDNDLSQFLRQASPHMIEVSHTAAGLAIMGEVRIDLLTLVAEVDDNGEICCWIYGIPTATP